MKNFKEFLNEGWERKSETRELKNGEKEEIRELNYVDPETKEIVINSYDLEGRNYTMRPSYEEFVAANKKLWIGKKAPSRADWDWLRPAKPKNELEDYYGIAPDKNRYMYDGDDVTHLDMDRTKKGIIVKEDLRRIYNFKSNQEILERIPWINEVYWVKGDIDMETRYLKNVDFFTNLQVVDGRFLFRRASILRSVDGLKKLEWVKNTLMFDECRQLRSIKGLENLREVGGKKAEYSWHEDGSLSFKNCTNLKNVDGLGNLEKVHGDLIFRECLHLENFNGFKKSITIGGRLDISDCKRLTNVDGLKNIKSCGGVSVGWGVNPVILKKLKAIMNPILPKDRQIT